MARAAVRRLSRGRFRGACSAGDTASEGLLGAVYEAVQEGLGRRVAVKVLHDTLAEDRTLVERFRREAESAAALGHPNIVQVTDFVAQAGEPAFLVVEYLVGRSLRTVLIDEARVSPERIGFIAAQVLSALGAAHRAGIVHRDLKPDNIFLTSVAGVDDIVKLLDFGVAKLSQPGPGDARLTLTGGLLGTPAYMAPEQARGDDVDARADLYAIGVILYQALAGKLPFDAPNPHKLLFAIIEQTPEPLAALRPSVPPAFIALVERAMAKSCDARFQSAAEMAAAILPWARGAAVTAATPSRFVVREGGVESDAFSQTVASIDEERSRPASVHDAAHFRQRRRDNNQGRSRGRNQVLAAAAHRVSFKSPSPPHVGTNGQRPTRDVHGVSHGPNR
jgi:serine/threonine-protein kinase